MVRVITQCYLEQVYLDAIPSNGALSITLHYITLESFRVA